MAPSEEYWKVADIFMRKAWATVCEGNRGKASGLKEEGSMLPIWMYFKTPMILNWM